MAGWTGLVAEAKPSRMAILRRGEAQSTDASHCHLRWPSQGAHAHPRLDQQLPGDMGLLLLLRLVERVGMLPFVIYRVLLGILILVILY